MGTALLVFRLAARDVRRHAAQAVLLVVAIAAAAATLTMGLALNGVTSQPPYPTTRAATKGPDVVAYLTSAAQAKQPRHAPGVASHSGPFPVASATIRFDGRQADVFAEGRSDGAGRGRPAAAHGGELGAAGRRRDRAHLRRRARRLCRRPGQPERQVVHRRGHRGDRSAVALPEPVQRHAGGAHAGGVEVLERLPAFVQHPVPVAPGRQGTRSSDEVGQIWTTEADAIGLTSKANPLTTYALNLKLTNPDDAQAFAYDRFAVPTATAPRVSTWEGTRVGRRAAGPGRARGASAGGGAARAARDRERGRPRRTPAVGVRAPGRAAEGRRGHAERGRGDLPRREPRARAFRRGGRPGGRLAGLAADHQARCGPHRHRGRAPLSLEHRGAGHRAGDRRWRSRRRSSPPSARRAGSTVDALERRRPPAEAPGRARCASRAGCRSRRCSGSGWSRAAPAVRSSARRTSPSPSPASWR